MEVTQAERDLKSGAEYPYHDKQPTDWAEAAALGILRDLNDRAGIKHGFREVDAGVRSEIVEHMAAIIRAARAHDDARGT